MQSKGKPVVLSLGSINLDVQMRVERWPNPGETLLANQFLLLGGGKAANVAIMAQRLGHAAVLLGHIGDDVLSHPVLQTLQQARIEQKYVTRMPNTKTAVSTIFSQGGDKAIVLNPNANEAWRKSDFDKVEEAIAAAPSGSVLVLDLEIPVWVAERASNRARSRGFAVVLDPSPAQRVGTELLSQAYAVTPNGFEAARLLEMNEIEDVDRAKQAARELVNRGVKISCIKLGAQGCVLGTRGGAELIPSPPVDVVDTTGAGDAFAGALAVALIENQRPGQAVRFAAAASALAVTGYGSSPSYPTRSQVERTLCGHRTARAS